MTALYVVMTSITVYSSSPKHGYCAMPVQNGKLYLCVKIAGVIIVIRSRKFRWAERVASIRGGEKCI
jgi:hypothetical protein